VCVNLDPDDPRPPYLQVAHALRAQILTRKIKPGEKLPSQSDLSAHYGVARGTVQDALRVLHQEGLTVARQGSGVFVRERTERPVGLRPHVEQAFQRAHVSLDFAGFSGETLHGVIQEPLDKIRVGRLTPEAIRIRVLLPDMSIPMALPCRADNQADDPAARARSAQITHRHIQAIQESVHELGEMGLTRDASVQVKVHSCPPLFKLYILNEDEAFFGFYPVLRHTVSIAGTPHTIFDPMGKDAVLFHHTNSDDDDSIGSQYVVEAKRWFDSIWSTISREYRA
jgi:DNA-binding transcriptional regulator YhcF (GntR family)